MLLYFNRARHLPHLGLKRQQGVVIVIALFVVTLVAAMAYVILARLERDTRRTNLILRNTQAEFYAQGSINWAIDQLRNNWEKKKNNQLVDALPIRSPVMNVNGYRIVSAIYDMQARFNINNLNKVDAQTAFKRLLQVVDPKLSEEKRQQITGAIIDWITPGAQQNEHSQYYLELSQAYRPARRPMYSASELRLVKGITPALFRSLQPYIIALPAPTLINVQSAPIPVLAILNQSMNLETAKIIVDLRTKTPFISVQQFLNLNIVRNHHIATDKITVTSDYFLLETIIVIEKQHIVLYTLLERSVRDNKTVITILWQSKGNY